MRRHTWTASQGTHSETRQEYLNRFKCTLVGQCLEAPRGEVIDIRGIFGMLNTELIVRGHKELEMHEQLEIRYLLEGCGFTSNTGTPVFWK
nr:MAG TPA: hypothetical protein [Bacteriophage sp.]